MNRISKSSFIDQQDFTKDELMNMNGDSLMINQSCHHFKSLHPIEKGYKWNHLESLEKIKFKSSGLLLNAHLT